MRKKPPRTRQFYWDHLEISERGEIVSMGYFNNIRRIRRYRTIFFSFTIPLPFVDRCKSHFDRSKTEMTRAIRVVR